MEQLACVDCGRAFAPTRRGQRRCPEHDAPVARARESYRTPRHRRARRQAIARDGYECAWCGSKYRLTMHHLDPKAEDGSDQHTLLLCGPDHSRYEADERYDRDTELRRFVHLQRAGRRVA